MVRIRVHELANELGRENKEIQQYLESRGYKKMTAVSVVPPAEIDAIRAMFGAGAEQPGEKAQEPETEKPSPKAAPKEEESDEKPKKKTIIRVYRGENATNQLQKRRPKRPEAAPAEPVKETAAEEPDSGEAVQSPDEIPASSGKEEIPVSSAEAPEGNASSDEGGNGRNEKKETAEKEQEKPVSSQGTSSVYTGRKFTGMPEMPKRRPVQEASGARADDRTSRTRGDAGSRRTPAGTGTAARGDRQQTQGRTFSGSGQNRSAAANRPQGGAQGRGGFGANRTQGAGRPQQGTAGRPGFAAGRPQGGAADTQSAKKGGRDRGRDYDKAKEDRRELGRDGSGQGGRRFNRVPKALQSQSRQNTKEQKKEVVTEIRVPDYITIRDLADLMKVQASQIVKNLFLKGEMVTVNHEVTFEKAQEIALEFDIIAEPEEKEDVIGKLLFEEEEDENDMVPRPPVVCVMGHVDHGKTSLLDAIRNTHVTDREAGGITQHIGAYMVTAKGQKITFLDTPGHEAFTAMRMRGANSTDIAVLVVAADDGVMPQTVEAINHAKAANVDIIVAINKIDKPNANIERVKQELSEYGLTPEDWGGQTIFCPVSARTHEGIDNLLDMILLSAEVDELKANPNRKARGLVLEAKLDKGRGPVATILIQKGTLHQGDFIACGAAYGKVRAMTDEKGKRLTKATPSMPVEIIGLSTVPDAGEVLVAQDSDRDAKQFAATFITEGKKELVDETRRQVSLDDLFEQIQEGSLKELPIVVKADVQGSVEAVKQSLLKLSNEEIVVKVIHDGVGAITESDVSLAAASNAIIIGFNVRPDAVAKAMSDQEKVEIKLYNVIYQAIEDVERAIKGMRAAVYEEKIIGHAEIRQIFKASGIGNIAGAYVRDGIFERGSLIRIFHGDEKIYQGELASLKRFKDDVKEVREGYECGLVFKDFNDFEVEDRVEAYKMVEVERD